MVVIAEDSHRRDRRYTYMAIPELGGFKLENGNAVKVRCTPCTYIDSPRLSPCRDISKVCQKGLE